MLKLKCQLINLVSAWYEVIGTEMKYNLKRIQTHRKTKSEDSPSKKYCISTKIQSLIRIFSVQFLVRKRHKVLYKEKVSSTTFSEKINTLSCLFN